MAILRVKPTLQKPIVGGSINEWGDILNSNIDAQDNFNNSVLIDSEAKDSEIERLDREKVSKTDIDTVVQTSVDEYINTNGKAKLDEHVESVNKPELDKYTEEKKKDISNVINDLGSYNINSETNYKTWIGSESAYQSLLTKENDVLYMTFDSLFNITTKYFKPKPKPSIVKNGLVCWLDGRDGESRSATWRDRSGNGNDTTLNNFKWTKESGFNGKSLKFDGVSDYAVIDLLSNLPSQENVTVEIMFSYGSYRNSTFVLSREMSTTAQSGLLGFFSNKENSFIRNALSWVDVFKNEVSINTNRYYTYVISNSSEIKTFLDSVLKNTTSDISLNNSLTGKFYIGCGVDESSVVKGFSNIYVHSIKIYNRALTEEEISQNYKYEQSIDRMVPETLDEKIYDKNYCIGNSSDLTEEQKKTFRLSNDKTKFVNGVNNVNGIAAETYTYEEIEKIMETPEWRNEEENMVLGNTVKNING